MKQPSPQSQVNHGTHPYQFVEPMKRPIQYLPPVINHYRANEQHFHISVSSPPRPAAPRQQTPPRSSCLARKSGPLAHKPFSLPSRLSFPTIEQSSPQIVYSPRTLPDIQSLLDSIPPPPLVPPSLSSAPPVYNPYRGKCALSTNHTKMDNGLPLSSVIMNCVQSGNNLYADATIGHPSMTEVKRVDLSLERIHISTRANTWVKSAAPFYCKTDAQTNVNASNVIEITPPFTLNDSDTFLIRVRVPMLQSYNLLPPSDKKNHIVRSHFLHRLVLTFCLLDGSREHYYLGDIFNITSPNSDIERKVLRPGRPECPLALALVRFAAAHGVYGLNIDGTVMDVLQYFTTLTTKPTKEQRQGLYHLIHNLFRHPLSQMETTNGQ